MKVKCRRSKHHDDGDGDGDDCGDDDDVSHCVDNDVDRTDTAGNADGIDNAAGEMLLAAHWPYTFTYSNT